VTDSPPDLVLDRDHPLYPRRLLTLAEPPEALHARGDLSLLDRPCAAIVGSREPTTYGIRIAYQAAYEAARAGIVVVSGMARGLDARAHRGALDAGGETIAVLGCGFDVPYPRENLDLLESIPERGLLLTELPPGTRPTKFSFPARNRMIAALAKCLLVVEGKEAGGTNNTAWWMQRLGKPVLAVPGRVDEEVAAGPNGLIRDLATPYLSPADLLAQFDLTWVCEAAQLRRYPGALAGKPGHHPRPQLVGGDEARRPGVATGSFEWGAPADGRARGGRSAPGAAAGTGRPPRSAPVLRGPAAPPELEPDALEALAEFASAEATVFDLVTPDPVHVDRIAERAGLAHGTLLAALSSLELKGLVCQLPGKLFRLAS